MFAQNVRATLEAQLVTENVATENGFRVLTNTSFAPTALKGYAIGNQGVFSWKEPVYALSYTNEVAASTGFAVTGTGTHLMGMKIPHAVIANYVGWEMINFAFATGANGSAITGFYYGWYDDLGFTATGANLTGAVTNSAFPGWNWTTPIPIDAEMAGSDFYVFITGTGATTSRTFLRYDTQGTGQAGLTCIRSTTGGDTWIDANANQTFCIVSDIRDPQGNVYKLYGDGTLVASNITTNTYTLATLPAPAKSYTVTNTNVPLLESPHSNAVVLGPTALTPPTNLTGVYSGIPTFDANLTWDYSTIPGANTFLLNEKFNTDPFVKGWQSLQGPGTTADCKWAWNVTSNLPNHPGVTSHSWISPNAKTPNNWLISPKVSGITGVTKLFWLVQPQDKDYPEEKYSVYISTTGNTIADFTAAPLFTEICTEAMAEGVVRSIDISQFAGQDIWIAFRHYDCTDNFRINLDDISVIANYNQATLIGGFYVYCNGVKVGTVGKDVHTYTHKIGVSGNYTFNVSAFALDLTNESAKSNNWTLTNVVIPPYPCIPPFDLKATEPTVTSVNLTWKDPTDYEFEKYIVDPSNSLSGFTNASYTFLKGIGFTPDQMSQWGFGFSLKAVKVPCAAAIAQNNANRVKLYKGVNATGYPNTMVYDQAVSTAFTAGWNTITLTTPQPVDISQNFYICFTGYNTSATAFHYLYFPNSPYVDKLTNLFAYASGASLTLQPTTTLFINQGTAGSMAIVAVFGYTHLGRGMEMEVAFENGGWNVISVTEVEETPTYQLSRNEKNIIFTPSPEQSFPMLERAKDPRNLGFFVYRDNVKLNATLLDALTYTNVPPAAGIYKYKVSANYNDVCGEVFTDPITVEFGDIKVKNLTATLASDLSVTLNWDPTQSANFVKYNVYKGNTLVGTITNVNTTTFKQLVEVGTHIFYVSATYNFGTGDYETKKASVSVTVSGNKPGVKNLTSNPVSDQPTQGLLTWEVPTDGDYNTITKCTSGVVNSSVGFGEGVGTIRTGHYFTSAQLGSPNTYNRCKSISVYIAKDEVSIIGTAEVYLATGTGIANIITGSRVAFTPVLDAWNTVEIPNTVVLNPSSALYVGYILTNWDGYPAAYDFTTLNAAQNGLYVTNATGALASTNAYGCWMIKMELYVAGTAPRPDVVGYNVVKNGDISTLTYTTQTEYAFTGGPDEYWVNVVYTGNIGSGWKKITPPFYQLTTTPPANGTLSVAIGGQDMTSGSYIYANNVINVTATPNTGYHLNTITVNATPIAGNTFTITSNSNVSAVIAPNTYTVVYNGNTNTGGSTASSTHTYNVAQNLTPNGFTKTGYTFAGWATTPTGTVAYTNGQSVMNLTAVDGATVNLYAIWTANTYTVVYNGNTNTGGATASSTHTYDVAKTLTPNGFTKTGYTFAGWATTPTGAKVYDDGQSVTNLTATPNGTFNLYAVWTAIKYNVSYSANTGSGTMSNSEHFYDAPKALSKNIFTKFGNNFIGWAETPLGVKKYNDEEVVLNLTTVAGSIVPLHALWSPKTYTLTLNASTGTCSQSTMTFAFGAPLVGIPSATQAGCQFVGWFIDGANVNTITEGWKWDDNKTAIAKFRYPINLTINGAAYGTVNPSVTPNYFDLGDNVTYNFTPNPGAHVASVVINGTTEITGEPEDTAPKNHLFTNINKAYNVTVTFAQNCYKPNITLAPGTKYKMTLPPSSVPVSCVPHGANALIEFSAAGCSEITNINIAGTGNMGVIPSHTFNNVTTSLPAISVEGNAQTFTITTTVNNGLMGTITCKGLSVVGPKEWSCNEDPTYLITPSTGHRIATVKVDGVNKPAAVASGSYAFVDLDASHTIDVVFELIPVFTIQFGPNPSQNGGKVYPTNNPTALYYIQEEIGTNVPFTIKADPGYVIDKVYVDDFIEAQAAQTGTYTFVNLHANHTIYATFKPIMFTINATTTTGGTINPPGAVQVPMNSEPTFTAVANAGYHLVNVMVDGTTPVGASYTFPPVTANHTIHATFAINTYTITPSAGPNGNISPNTVQTVNHGTSKAFNFYPATGYKVDVVLIDGVPDIAAAQNGSYTFVNVTKNHTIDVTFTKQTYTITSSSGANGEVTPLGVEYVKYWEHSEIYVFNPDPGFKIKHVIIDGAIDYLAIQNSMYRFLNVTGNHTIHVTFMPENFTITASATAGGAINPSGAVIVPNGANKTFYFAPQAGSKLARVIIDGIDNPNAVAAGYYTFTEVDDNHIISAQFEKADYTVTLPTVTGAVVTAVNGSSSPVAYGGKFMFVVDLFEGYSQSNPTIKSNNMIIKP